MAGVELADLTPLPPKWVLASIFPISGQFLHVVELPAFSEAVGG
jgi:hypothetical protein